MGLSTTGLIPASASMMRACCEGDLPGSIRIDLVASIEAPLEISPTACRLSNACAAMDAAAVIVLSSKSGL